MCESYVKSSLSLLLRLVRVDIAILVTAHFRLTLFLLRCRTLLRHSLLPGRTAAAGRTGSLCVELGLHALGQLLVGLDRVMCGLHFLRRLPWRGVSDIAHVFAVGGFPFGRRGGWRVIVRVTGIAIGSGRRLRSGCAAHALLALGKLVEAGMDEVVDCVLSSSVRNVAAAEA